MRKRPDEGPETEVDSNTDENTDKKSNSHAIMDHSGSGEIPEDFFPYQRAELPIEWFSSKVLSFNPSNLFN